MYITHFVAYFSRNGRKLTLVDPPPEIGEVIGSRLRTAWPHKISADRTPEDGIYTVGLRSTTFGCKWHFIGSPIPSHAYGVCS